MILAVASGKGGTGKTTVSAALASLWHRPVVAVDLDVEEPNLHLFLHPEEEGREIAYMTVPEIDEALCTRCRACAELCQFKAITVLGDIPMTFPEMCHGCGGCFDVCPEQAVQVGRRELGEVIWGHSCTIRFLMGRLRVGEAMSPPLMRAVKERLKALGWDREGDVIIDAPPGVSCPAVNAVMGSDAVLLVTEPTLFGLYDLDLAREAFEFTGKPMAVAINRAGLGDRGVYEYCRDRGLPILAEIPFDRDAAATYARGRILTETSERMKGIFVDLAARVGNMLNGGESHHV